MEYHETLKAAVIEAMNQAREDQDSGEIDAINHLMAQKREHGDGSTSWAVRISDSFDSDWLTHLSNSIFDCAGTEDEVAARIEGFWDEDWTEIQRDSAVGDFRPGSSNFVTRSEIE